MQTGVRFKNKSNTNNEQDYNRQLYKHGNEVGASETCDEVK